jgi:vanillate O-demethylase monooxygenase subunit
MAVVLYRTQSGRVVALDDRCPHRSAPLSAGRVVDDDIECRYHGFRFGPDGACKAIPSQRFVPQTCRVHAFPVIEKPPFVWVWTGDPSRAAQAEEPADMSWAVSPAWAAFGGVTEMDGNYMMLKENTLDLTHFGFLHGQSLQLFYYDRPPRVTTQGNKVRYEIEFDDVVLPPPHRLATGIGENERVLHEYFGEYCSPALQFAGERITHESADGTRDRFTFHVMHATTPLSMRRYRYFWFVGWDIPGLPSEVLDTWKEMTPRVFDEDRQIIEATQHLLDYDVRGSTYPEIIVKADEAAILARRQLAKQLALDSAAIGAPDA